MLGSRYPMLQLGNPMCLYYLSMAYGLLLTKLLEI